MNDLNNAHFINLYLYQKLNLMFWLQSYILLLNIWNKNSAYHLHFNISIKMVSYFIFFHMYKNYNLLYHLNY